MPPLEMSLAEADAGGTGDSEDDVGLLLALIPLLPDPLEANPLDGC